MSKEELLDEVFENYSKIVWRITNMPLYTKEEFINKCKTDTTFSNKWGLTIEERELSLEERNNSLEPNEAYLSFFGINVKDDLESKKLFDKEGRPTKLITITYNDKTIESYE